jgi:proline racemase
MTQGRNMEQIRTVDYHTAGEPFRIVTEPPTTIEGSTVAERRLKATPGSDVDDLRRVLCFEPRGHADMYGGILTPPDDDGADLGVLFWHKDGFSTACGHGTIALGVWAIESGRVPTDSSGMTNVTIDVPSGRVVAKVHTDYAGEVESVDFINVPSFAIEMNVTLDTTRGIIHVDVGYGGAIYAHVRASEVGLSILPEQSNELIAFGREVRRLLNESPLAKHPGDATLSGVFGTVIYEELEDLDGDLHQRNATIFGEGMLDRSPCGSGSASRLAMLMAQGKLTNGQALIHDSIVGSRFTCSIVGTQKVFGIDAIIPQITGMAYRTGSSEFTVDARDPLSPGFVFR